MHAPIYNSNSAHYMEGESMRAAFECWFVQYKVDVVFAGHVHAYERSYRISNIHYNVTGGCDLSRARQISSCLHNRWRWRKPRRSCIKVSRDSKDDSGRFSGLLSSSGSPRIGFSRSSSRLSLQDELDDIDFSCPFIVDDVDTCDSSLR